MKAAEETVSQSHCDGISDALSIRSTSSGKRMKNSSTTGNQKWQKKAEATDIVSEELCFMKAVGKLVSKDVLIEEGDNFLNFLNILGHRK